MNEKKEERWAIAEGTVENGLPYIIRFREDLPNEETRKKLSTLIIVSWVFEFDDGSGMPTSEIAGQMEDFEDLIDEALIEKGTARLMTVFTGDGLREWQFYTDDDEFFMQKFNEVLEGKPVLPLEIESFVDENWDAYNEYIGLITEE